MGQRSPFRTFSKLFEDAHYVFVNKPAGVPGRLPRHGRPSPAAEAIQRLIPPAEGEDLRTCYPLDTHVSGVWGLAKTEKAAEHFATLLREGGVRQQLVAIVRGKYKAEHGGSAQRKPSGKAAAARKVQREGAFAATLIKQHTRRAVVRCVFGGRRLMDVRAGLDRMRLPVLGDPKFDPRRGGKRAGRLYLHVQRLEFKHPFTGEAIRVDAPVPESFDTVAQGENVLEECLEVALAGRLPWLLDESSDAYRLLDAAPDGVPGLVAERLGPVVILQVQQGKFDGGEEALQQAATWYGRRLRPRAVYVKRIPRDRSQEGRRQPKALTDAQPIWGKPVQPEVEIKEDGISVLVRPYDGYLTGFFTAHAENRRWVRRHAEGLRVLNLFAYTCGFSVAAAVGGAASTASVDVSKKVLEWGKRNFEANGLSLEDHRFYCSDAFEFFKRAERQELRFDLILLDLIQLLII